MPAADAVVESESYDIPDGQALVSRLHWDVSLDISPSDSASSKASKGLATSSNTNPEHFYFAY